MAFQLREAREADIQALARLHVQTFNETHRGGRPGGPTYELRERQWHEAFEHQDGSWFCYVIQNENGELPGYAGELNKIYLLQRVQRHGLGRLLLAAVARRFLERGVTSMLLFGDAGNPSNGFYERFDAERLYSPAGEFHGGYGWRDLRALVARCGP